MNNVARPKKIRSNGCGSGAVFGLVGGLVSLPNSATGGMPLDNDMVLPNPKRARKEKHAFSNHKLQHRNEVCLLGLPLIVCPCVTTGFGRERCKCRNGGV